MHSEVVFQTAKKRISHKCLGNTFFASTRQRHELQGRVIISLTSENVASNWTEDTEYFSQEIKKKKSITSILDTKQHGNAFNCFAAPPTSL